MIPKLLLLCFIVAVCQCQMNLGPLMNLFGPESMSKMVELASELGTMAATNVANNEKNVAAQVVEQPREVPLENNARPSQVLGQSISQITSQSRNAFIDALSPLQKPAQIPQVPAIQPKETEGIIVNRRAKTLIPPRPTEAPLELTPPPIEELPTEPSVPSPPVPTGSSERRLAPPVVTGEESLTPEQIQRISKELAAKMQQVSSSANIEAGSVPAPAPPVQPVAAPNPVIQQNPFLKLADRFLRGATGQPVEQSNAPGEIPSMGIRDFVPGADKNFGIPKGKGCLPFLSEFLQVAYGNCQQVADEGAWDAWGNELKSAILTGQIDLLKASQETCRRGAERQQCGSLRESLATCDILRSLQIGTQLQRAMKRCEDVGGLMDQNPMVILGQINNLIGGEFTQGFFNNFLGSKNGR